MPRGLVSVFERLLFGFILVSLFAAPGYSQSTTGTIEGVVRDESGGALPGVQIEANSPALIQKNLTVYTNQEGFYRLPLLPPGTYTVVYTIQGFQTVTRTGLLVSAGQSTVVNTTAKVAGLEESVTVVGDSPMLDPTDPRLSFTYNSKVIENLPTGRTLTALMQTIPGVEKGTSGFEDTAQNILGAGIRGNSYTLDQGNATDPRIQSNMAGLLPYDIVEEVQVLKGGKPAEVGFAFGGYVQVVTKSGGNDLHGAANIHYQGQALQGDNLDDALRRTGVSRSNRLQNATDASVTGGWRFVRDKLWWFGSARHQQSAEQLLGFPENSERTIDGYFWKNTYQAHPKHRILGGLTYWTDDQDLNSGGGAVVPALADDRGALRVKDWSGLVFNPRWNGVLSDRLIAEVGGTFSRFEINYNEDDTAGIGRLDLVTGRRAGNPGTIGRRVNPSYNKEFGGSLSWFVPEALGRHQVKVGASYTRTRVPGRFTQIGDHEVNLNSGVPSQVAILNTPVEVELDEDVTSFFAQDEWSLGKGVTVNFGVRYDGIGAFTKDSPQGGGAFANTPLATTYPILRATTVPGRDLFTFHSPAPRASVSWSLNEDTIFKSSFARYYHFMQSQLLPGTGVLEVTRLTLAWTDLNNDRQYQIGEEGRLISVAGGFGAGATIDANLKHPYSDEFVIGVSRQIGSDFSINANFIYRKEKQLTNLINPGVPFSAFSPVSAVDPGLDGVTGTADDSTLTVFSQSAATLGQDRRVLTNPEGNDRTYKGVEIVGTKRLAKQWQFVGSIVLSRMEVISPASDTGQSTWFQNPNALLNARGLDTDNLPYQYKAQGVYEAPWGITLSAVYRYSSGLPITRQIVVRGLPQGTVTVFAEPRGSRKLDAGQNVDAQVEKSIRLTDRMRLGLILEAFNLTNESTILAQGTRSGVDYGAPQRLANPRIARVGARIVW